MSKINREKTGARLREEAGSIVFESDEDDGAMEYRGEVESILIALHGSDSDIVSAAEWVGLERLLIWED